MAMPEEINRLCTDVLCDYLFTTDKYATENLQQEGVSSEKVIFVGNVMIDTLLKHRQMAAGLNVLQKIGLSQGDYATLTMHRPSNVDDRETFCEILETLTTISQSLPIIFPIHPRTRKMAQEFGLMHYFNEGKKIKGIWITEPFGYLDFLHLNMNAKMVLTDSGGLQEETTVLGVPCITMRRNTERPITCDVGTNTIVGNDPIKIRKAAQAVLDGDWSKGSIPEKWDGHAAERIVDWLVHKAGPVLNTSNN
jgi:UDP-N-acetylglucosamine 2-epimerase (non-hydrolysing)